MRFGAPVENYSNPAEWIARLREGGYTAAYAPPESSADPALAEEYRAAAERHDIVIAEVGAWSNPVSPDPEERKKALEHCVRQLRLADRLRARCCVNIAGSMGSRWDGYHPDNYTPAAFRRIVETVREIIDRAEPQHTFYTIEMMQWMIPDGPDVYLELIAAVDRPRFAVHSDMVNLVNSPRRYADTGGMIRDCFQKLGPYVKSCHLKDIILVEDGFLHFEETAPGTGALDIAAYLRAAEETSPDLPVMLEHLPMDAYPAAAAHVRSVAAAAGISLKK